MKEKKKKKDAKEKEGDMTAAVATSVPASDKTGALDHRLRYYRYKDRQLGIRIPAVVFDRIEQVAKKKGVSKSALIRAALMEYFGEDEE